MSQPVSVGTIGALNVDEGALVDEVRPKVASSNISK